MITFTFINNKKEIKTMSEVRVLKNFINGEFENISNYDYLDGLHLL